MQEKLCRLCFGFYVVCVLGFMSFVFWVFKNLKMVLEMGFLNFVRNMGGKEGLQELCWTGWGGIH